MAAQESRFPYGILIIVCLVLTIYSVYQSAALNEEMRSLRETMDSTVAQMAMDIEYCKEFIEEESDRHEMDNKKAEKVSSKKPTSIESKRAEARRILAAKKAEKATNDIVKEVSGQEVVTKKTAVKRSTPTTKKTIIKPTAKVRVENRYVIGTTFLPVGKFTQEGTVKVRVYVRRIGNVAKTEIVESDITDEDILYSCREAALKTNFSYDSSADYQSLLQGTITYTFSAE